MSKNAEWLASLTPQQREELRARLLRRQQTVLEAPQLSHGQEALLHIQDSAPEGCGYNTMYVGRLGADVDEQRLRAAFELVSGRHAALRTVYQRDADGHAHPVRADVAVDFVVLDASGEPAEQLEQRIVTEASRPFSLDHGPVWRARLFRRGDDSRLLIAAHHIAIDFWSYVVLVEDLIAYYAEPSGATLSALRATYEDFARRERAAATDGTHQRHWEYWRSELEDFPPAVELPLDRPRSNAASEAGEVLDLDIPSDLVRSLTELSRQEGTTLYHTFLAAFFVFLQRHCGQNDILVAAPTSGRTSVELEDLVGYFVNPVVLRGRIGPSMTFRELVKQVRETSLRSLDHQSFPFPELINRLGVPREPGRAPLCDVWFGWDRPHRRDGWASRVLRGESGSCSPLPMETLTIRQVGAPHDVMLVVFEREQSLRATWHYRQDLFHRATIEALARRFVALLERAAASPNAVVADLDLLTQDERRRLLFQRGGRGADYPRDASVGALFESGVDRHPEACAVDYPERSLSYRELNEEANRLAHHLQSLGVAPGERVAISVERSTAMVVATMAVVKAGAVYVPLDPDYPAHRIEMMLDDASVRFAVVSGVAGSALPAGRIELVDIDDPAIATRSRANPPNGANGGNLLYVMYTSGSTGKPKGIAIPHRAVTRLVVNTDYVSLGPGDRIAQAANASFDAATFEIWGALLQGGTVVGIRKSVLLSVEDLAAELRSRRITTMFLTTALFQQVAREKPSAFVCLRDLLYGGEVCDPRLVARVLEHGGPKRLLHVYGPTECTTFATWHLVTNVGIDDSRVPIGKPIANTTAYVLDSDRRLVPPGVPGELYLGGDGLALGYLEREELTEERFIASPFQDGERLYRTGDLVRWTVDGLIEYLDRLDQQVKIRGFRIELQEVEAALRSCQGVAEAVVLARPDPSGAKRLVAYVTAEGGQALEARELRTQLSRLVPSYMTPATIMTIARLPLNPNGKVDRKALPDVPPEVGSEALAQAEPANELEQRIAAIWAQVLERKAVGRHDNFFDLGGHSLLITRVHAQLKSKLGLTASIVELFQHPTVASLALHLSGVGNTDESLAEARNRAELQLSARERRRKRALSAGARE